VTGPSTQAQERNPTVTYAAEQLDEDRLPADPRENAEPDIRPDEQRPVLLPDENDYPRDAVESGELPPQAWDR
jgi:hypothetical protein